MKQHINDDKKHLWFKILCVIFLHDIFIGSCQLIFFHYTYAETAFILETAAISLGAGFNFTYGNINGKSRL